MSPHRNAFCFALVAAVVLLIAQFGAMAHAYTHSPETRAVPAQQAAQDFCADCLNFAPLLAAAGTPDVLPFALPQAPHAEPRNAPIAVVDLEFLVAFRSRAPPTIP